jgi:hypothetical protein
MEKLEFIKSNGCDFEDISKPLAITYDNKFLGDQNTKNLIYTLQLQNWDYTVIRINESYRNHLDKVKGYYELLKILPKDKVVVLMDSRDVFCLRDSVHFIENFKFLRTEIVVSLEIWCNTSLDVQYEKSNQCIPLVEYWRYHRVHSWPNRRYVNSGLIAGKVSELLKMFEFLNNNSNLSSDDQELVAIYMNKNPDRIYGDYEANLLHTSTFSKAGGSINMTVQNYDSPKYGDILGRGAFFLHFPSLSTKGQKYVYEITKKLVIDESFNSIKFNQLYNLSENTFSNKDF